MNPLDGYITFASLYLVLWCLLWWMYDHTCILTIPFLFSIQIAVWHGHKKHPTACISILSRLALFHVTTLILFLLSAIYLKFCEFGISLDLVFCWFTSPCSCIFFFKGGVGGVCVVKSAKQWLVTLMPWGDVTKKNHVLLELKHEACFYLKREKAIYALTRFFFSGFCKIFTQVLQIFFLLCRCCDCEG